MRELRNTKIIAVDHGYGNMKTANTVTPTGIKAYETEPIFTGNILEYNGIYYRIGEGHKEFIPDKAMDEEYYLLTLMAIARELNVFSIREAKFSESCSFIPAEKLIKTVFSLSFKIWVLLSVIFLSCSDSRTEY